MLAPNITGVLKPFGWDYRGDLKAGRLLRPISTLATGLPGKGGNSCTDPLSRRMETAPQTVIVGQVKFFKMPTNSGGLVKCLARS